MTLVMCDLCELPEATELAATGIDLCVTCRRESRLAQAIEKKHADRQRPVHFEGLTTLGRQLADAGRLVTSRAVEDEQRIYDAAPEHRMAMEKVHAMEKANVERMFRMNLDGATVK